MSKIQDYAVIGNGRSAALISLDGSLDWLCWPRFDSPSLFGKILDDQKGGFWKITSSTPARNDRKYIENTNVLQTVFTQESGILILTDFMPAFTEEEKQKSLQPEHELIREVECLEGKVEIEMQFMPRPNYGLAKFVLKDLGSIGIRLQIKQQLFTLLSNIKLKVESQSVVAKISLKAGEKVFFSLSYSDEGPAVIPFYKELHKLKSTIQWWQTWAGQVKYEGPYRKEVIRSALALKLLSFSPSGAFIAAPTTSLPEALGATLNWDYRFCWLRDASFTVQALFGLGFKEEAEAFVSWLLHSTRLTLPKLRVLYNVYGESSGKEVFLSYWKGYADSRPVRIGNAAENQMQLDIYGEVIDAVHRYVFEGKALDRETQKMLTNLGKFVCQHWSEADNGIWEDRDQLRHYTHSRLMCWVALDRLIEMNKKHAWVKESLLERFRKNRELIREDIKKNSWNASLDSYSSILNGSTLDTSLLLLSLFQFEEINSSRMQSTYRHIRERLYREPGLVYRRDKSIEDDEGAFVMCSFWIVEFLAKSGKKEEAGKMFRQLLNLANDVGLFSEEIDIKTHDFLGNFPQAFTHIGLINAALAISQRE